MIIGLAVWLLVRWRRGAFHVQVTPTAAARCTPTEPARHWQAYGIGLVHGIGGSGGVGVLLLALDPRPRARARGARALRLLHRASRWRSLSTGFGRVLGSARLRASFQRLAPGMALLSLAFGVWYALGALELAPYFL